MWWAETSGQPVPILPILVASLHHACCSPQAHPIPHRGPFARGPTPSRDPKPVHCTALPWGDSRWVGFLQVQLYETSTIAGAPTWYWSWQDAVTCWSTSV